MRKWFLDWISPNVQIMLLLVAKPFYLFLHCFISWPINHSHTQTSFREILHVLDHLALNYCSVKSWSTLSVSNFFFYAFTSPLSWNRLASLTVFFAALSASQVFWSSPKMRTRWDIWSWVSCATLRTAGAAILTIDRLKWLAETQRKL